MSTSTKGAAKDISLLPATTFVLDNGAFSIKAGFAPDSSLSNTDTLQRCRQVPNSLVRTRDRRIHTPSQQANITQWSEATYRRPIERGQLVNWETEKEIWNHSFFDGKTAERDMLVKEVDTTTLLLTETPNTMHALQRNADEIIMEEWGFGGYARVVAPRLNAYNDLGPLLGDTVSESIPTAQPQIQQCLLVVDSGYSHTIITPMYEGIPIQRGIRRIDLGGKHLTNLLKEIISVRYFDLHQDTKIVNDVKEDVCFVSLNIDNDMDRSWKGDLSRRRKKGMKLPTPIPRAVKDIDAMDVDAQCPPSSTLPRDPDSDPLVDYILPDGFKIRRGFSRPHKPLSRDRNKKKASPVTSLPSDDTEDEVSMTLGSERFCIPEILFTPSDVSSRQPGIAEAIMQSLALLPPALQVALLSNILIVGGNARMAGFAERLRNEVRMLTPVEYDVRVAVMPDPVTSTWLGGARMAGNREAIRKIGITKEEYAEYGSGWVGRRFAGASK